MTLKDLCKHINKLNPDLLSLDITKIHLTWLDTFVTFIVHAEGENKYIVVRGTDIEPDFNDGSIYKRRLKRGCNVEEHQ